MLLYYCFCYWSNRMSTKFANNHIFYESDNNIADMRQEHNTSKTNIPILSVEYPENFIQAPNIQYNNTFVLRFLFFLFASNEKIFVPIRFCTAFHEFWKKKFNFSQKTTLFAHFACLLRLYDSRLANLFEINSEMHHFTWILVQK